MSMSELSYESPEGYLEKIAKVARYIELCDPLPRIENPFSRIINSFPQIRQFVLPDCNSFARFTHFIPSI